VGAHTANQQAVQQHSRVCVGIASLAQPQRVAAGTAGKLPQSCNAAPAMQAAAGRCWVLPLAFLMARTSALSPTRVLVAWALM
jgi:hypothetical protein